MTILLYGLLSQRVRLSHGMGWASSVKEGHEVSSSRTGGQSLRFRHGPHRNKGPVDPVRRNVSPSLSATVELRAVR